nr:zinc knuckle CX2CX4HX4C [Tanacetum cinerariifolium]
MSIKCKPSKRNIKVLDLDLENEGSNHGGDDISKDKQNDVEEDLIRDNESIVEMNETESRKDNGNKHDVGKRNQGDKLNMNSNGVRSGNLLCVVGYSMSIYEMRYNLRRMWRRYGLGDIIVDNNEIFFFKFKNVEGKAGYARILVEVDAKKGSLDQIEVKEMERINNVRTEKYGMGNDCVDVKNKRNFGWKNNYQYRPKVVDGGNNKANNNLSGIDTKEISNDVCQDDRIIVDRWEAVNRNDGRNKEDDDILE